MTFEINEDGEVESDGSTEETESTPFVVTRKPSKGNDLSDTPVENAAEVPLFAQFGKKGLKTVTYLKIVKLDQPGAGYKGNIGISSTLETIAQLYGNGLYTIEACNHKHQQMRILENVRISIATEAEKTNTSPIIASGDNAKDKHISQLIGGISDAHKSEVSRIEKLSDTVTKQVTEQGKTFVQLVQTTTESAAQREREHMAGVNKGQQDFFANMMLATNQMFQQTMAMMIAGHQQQMEMMRASSERNANEPMTLVTMLMKGLELGKDLEGDDGPDWLKGLSVGGDVIGNLAKLATAAPAGFLPKVANPASTPAVITPAPKQKRIAPKVFDDEEIVEFLKLKKTLRARGIAVADMVREANKHYESVPDSELNGGFAEDETDENISSEETSNLEGGGNPDASGTEEKVVGSGS